MKKSYQFIILFSLTVFVGIHICKAQIPVYSSEITQNMVNPVRAAIDNADVVYVTDAMQKNILKYDINGNNIGSINPGGSPISIAIDASNQIFIGDGVTGQILKVDQSGVTTLFYAGAAFPCSMTFGTNGLLYVVDSPRHEVLVLNTSGQVVQTIGTANLIYPTGVAFDSKNDRVLVAEHGGIGGGFNPTVKIWIYNLQGTLLSSFGSHGNIDGKFYRIQGIAVGRCGNIYVPEPYQGNVSVFTENGVFISRFSQYGYGSDHLNVPLDIIIDKHDRILMTSENAGSIEVYQVNFSLPTSDINCGNKTICSGETADIPIYFTGTAPWTFTYTVDNLNPTTITNTYDNPYILTVSNSGTYNVTTVSDAISTGTCVSGKSTITVNSTLPTASISSLNTNLCPGTTADISVDFTGSAPWTFTYTKDGLNPTTISNVTSNPYTLSVSAPGTYELVNLTGNGCNGTNLSGTAVITQAAQPTALITSGNFGICSGSSVDLPINLSGNAPWTVTYSIDGGTPLTYTNITSNPYIIPVSTDASYQIISVSDVNCIGTTNNGNALFTTNQLPTSTIISGTTSICMNTTTDVVVEFTGLAPWSFEYTIDGLNPTTINNINSSQYVLTTSTPGIYQVTAVNDANCTGSQMTGVGEVLVNTLPAVNLGADISICSGDSYLLDAGSFAYYLWNDLSMNQTLTVTSAGDYSVSITDNNGCSNADTIHVSMSQLPLSLFTFNINNLEVTFTNNSQNAASSLWNFGDLTTSTDINPIHTYASPGVYIVSLTTSNPPCVDNSINQTVNIITTNTDNGLLENGIEIYPNPTNGLVTLEINRSTQSDITIEIYSANGQLVYSKLFNTKRATEQINLSSFADGIYTVKMKSNDVTKISKLVLTK